MYRQSTPRVVHSERISASARKVTRYMRHQQVFGQGDRVTAFYHIISGAVRSSKLMADGRRQVDAFHLPGELFGFERGMQHRSMAEALEAAEIMVYDHSRLEDGLHPAFSRIALSTAMERAQDHAVLLGRCTAIEKIAAFLVDLGDRLRTDIVELPMDRYDIADYLGITMETVSRTLWQLDRKSLISITQCRKVWIRDRMKLRRLAPWELRAEGLRCEADRVIPFPGPAELRNR
jgi:CRP/FNR family transcriptional regulator, nitrogen fixation regulation protein